MAPSGLSVSLNKLWKSGFWVQGKGWLRKEKKKSNVCFFLKEVKSERENLLRHRVEFEIRLCQLCNQALESPRIGFLSRL